MTLRTPRRRISPRTKRRYRAIREFFRRALGNPSQPDIKINSSIAVNVTDLKRKIVGLEQQLDEVNRHCKDIACLDCSRRESESIQSEYQQARESISYIPSEVKHDIETIKEQTESSYERNLDGIETKFLYKPAKGHYEKSDESEIFSQHNDIIDENQTQNMLDEHGGHVFKAKNKKSKLNRINDYGSKLYKNRVRSVHDNLTSVNSTSSFHSLTQPRVSHFNPGYSGHPNDRQYLTREYKEPIHVQRDKKHREHVKRNAIDLCKEPYEQKSHKTRKHKHYNREVDKDFIADIIRRQYRPVKMFGRRESDLSQISAPICRDQEFAFREDIQEGTELCSCCIGQNKHKVKQNELSEMRSICDTRLYSSKRHTQGRYRRVPVDLYNNSDLYDLIPVKEKSSPKSRKKFNDDNMIPYQYYKEVPPSPRTLRPRLNLKAQHNTEFDDYMSQVKYARRKASPHRHRRQRDRVEVETDITSEAVPNFIIKQPNQLRKAQKHMTCQVEQELCQQADCVTMSDQPYPTYVNEQANVAVDTTMNNITTQDTEKPIDKTDKALCEIKDILQSFLHEIKKETIASQCDKSDISSKTAENVIQVTKDNSAKMNSSVLHNSRSMNNYGIGTPFMAPFQNPCCYPIMPMCPMNYPITMQNGYMMPSDSYTCTNCVNTAKEPVHNEHCCNKNMTSTGTGRTDTCHTETCLTDSCNTETEELIKEIYKFVAQSPVRKKDYESSTDRHGTRRSDHKMLTTRSVGESSKLSRHDAKVGTAPLKCYSKSCEAIGSKMSSEPYSSGTNASYSDTILEKLSLEVTQSTSETEMYTTTTEEKRKPNKFSKVLQSMGLMKKKRRDVIEELSESESTADAEMKPKTGRSPYRQELTNYMVHGQEYYHPPPMSPRYPEPHEYQTEYHPPYNPVISEYLQPPPQPPIHNIYPPGEHNLRLQSPTAPYNSKQRPTAPPYPNAYDNHYKQMQQPQVPLCLREIEVKSTGTQSDRKMSLFRKIQKKMQPPVLAAEDDYQKTCSTQTQVAPKTPKSPILTKPLFNWKSLQAKAMAEHGKLNTDPVKFSMKAQRDLAEGDAKIRKAMLKKLFYKRNPFSPRNLIVRTLLGKDKSSFGDAPTMFRPRMFF